VKNLRRYIWALLFLLILSACSPAGTPSPETKSESSPPVQSPPGQSVNYYPLDTMTRIEEIDIILTAVANGDTQELIKLFRFTKTRCMTVNALGGPPPCRDGEEEGTVVEVLPSLGVEGNFLRKADMGIFPGLNVIGIFAVYEVSDSAFSEENYPAGDYGIALVGANGAPDIILQVRKEGIVRIDYVFDAYGNGLVEALERNAVEFVLPPVSP